MKSKKTCDYCESDFKDNDESFLEVINQKEMELCGGCYYGTTWRRPISTCSIIDSEVN
jgi:hypothetical protein